VNGDGESGVLEAVKFCNDEKLNSRHINTFKNCHD
jgi:hypothetical protein